VEPDRPQPDLPVAYVIDQQYSSANFVSLLSHSRKDTFGALKVIISIFPIIKNV
jgi:hypothetical protein